MRILVTGAGVIGCHTARQLSEQGHDVTLVDVAPNMTAVKSIVDTEKVPLVNCDVTDNSAIENSIGDATRRTRHSHSGSHDSRLSRRSATRIAGQRVRDDKPARLRPTWIDRPGRAVEFERGGDAFDVSLRPQQVVVGADFRHVSSLLRCCRGLAALCRGVRRLERAADVDPGATDAPHGRCRLAAQTSSDRRPHADLARGRFLCGCTRLCGRERRRRARREPGHRRV